jgi:CRISPR-associated protein Cas2
MSLTVIVTRNVEDRFRGFILSCMPEISPGLYVSSNLNAGVRERLWEVIEKWHRQLPNGSIQMIVEDKRFPSGIRVSSLGEPAKEIVDFDGYFLTLKR